MADHSHLLFLVPATVPLATAINLFKANSSRFAREQGIGFAWQSGYAAFSVSRSQLDAVTDYVRSQKEHHVKMTFEQELVAFLNKSGVEYDTRYVFG
jgi:REP element-mobilizing transposase RayT